LRDNRFCVYVLLTLFSITFSITYVLLLSVLHMCFDIHNWRSSTIKQYINVSHSIIAVILL